MAAENDGVLPAPQQAFPALGQGDGHLAGDGIHLVPGIVEDLALQHGQNVKQRHVFQLRSGDQVHVVGGDVVLGEHSVQGAVLVGHRQGGNGGLTLEGFPGLGHGDVGIQHRGRIKFQVLNLGEHTGNAGGGLKAEAVQHQLGLIGYPAQAGGLVFPVPKGVAQGRVGHGGHDGVGIRIPVSGDVNGVHNILLAVEIGKIYWKSQTAGKGSPAGPNGALPADWHSLLFNIIVPKGEKRKNKTWDFTNP